ncbi:MAG: diguanylate cyclase [Solirubrobacteraceae bacterium]|nr:diguanylate cyclase [Solirubrobacteraceae bacterium]
MAQNGYSERLLAIIDAQNRIAATKLDLDAVMELVVERARALTEADAAVVELVEGDNMVYAAVAGTACSHKDMRLRRATSLSGTCVATAKTLRSDDTSVDPRVDTEASARVGAGSIVCVPLRHERSVVGVLKVYSAPAHAFEDADVETLELLSGLIAAQLTHADDFADQYDNSRRDSLTGLGNRRAYEERLTAECSRARRHEEPVTLCLLDLDGFKRVNDEHGHPAGDELLRQVGATLARLRAEDSAFRIGGDEFAVLLPNSSAAQAEVAIERLAAHIAARAFGAISASFGLADGPPQPDALHAAADERLLAVKAERRAQATAV